MDVELPDGTVVTDVPEGTTQAQLMSRVQKASKPSLWENTQASLKQISKLSPMGAITTAGGLASESLSKAGKIAGGFATDTLAGHVPPEVAGAAGAAAEIGIPALITGGITKAVGEPALQNAGRWMMHKALRPSADEVVSGDAAKAITTMLNEGGGLIVGKGTNVTPAGAAELRQKISDIHKEVAAKLAASPETVDKAWVASEVTKALTKFRQQVRPGADTKAVLDAWNEFNATWGSKIPVPEAQLMKQGTQQILSKKYGELSNAGSEAEKYMARGLRLGIEDKYPEVAKLNAKEAELLNAFYMTDKRAAIEAGKNVAGLTLLANNPKTAALFAADRSALFKSILARILNNTAGTATFGAGAVAGGTAAAGLRRLDRPEQE